MELPPRNLLWPLPTSKARSTIRGDLGQEWSPSSEGRSHCCSHGILGAHSRPLPNTSASEETWLPAPGVTLNLARWASVPAGPPPHPTSLCPGNPVLNTVIWGKSLDSVSPVTSCVRHSWPTGARGRSGSCRYRISKEVNKLVLIVNRERRN